MRNFGDSLDVHHDTARIGEAFDKDGTCLAVDLLCKIGRVGGIGPADLPAEGLERLTELIDRSAVKLARGDEIVTRLKQRMENKQLR